MGRLRFRGLKKRLVFDDNHERFRRFQHKIIHVIVNEDPVTWSARTLLERQRAAEIRKQVCKNSVVKGLERALALPTDLVIFSDVDEIARASVIRLMRDCTGFAFPVTLETRAYIYDFGCVETTYAGSGVHTRSWRRLKVAEMRQISYQCRTGWMPKTQCPNDLRDSQVFRLGVFVTRPLTILDAGWHLSFFLGLEEIVYKLRSYDHVERDTEHNKNPDYIRCLVYKCQHINMRDVGTRSEGAPMQGMQQMPIPRWVREQSAKGREPFRSWFPQKGTLRPSHEALQLC